MFQPQSIQTQPFATQPPLQSPPRQTPTPELPKPKPPLPEEYVYLQTVFNELRIACINAAANPVRKISFLLKTNGKLNISFLFSLIHSKKNGN